jgi:hypothetical protein
LDTCAFDDPGLVNAETLRDRTIGQDLLRQVIAESENGRSTRWPCRASVALNLSRARRAFA